MNKTIIIKSNYSPYGSHEVKNLGIFSRVLMSCGGGMGGSKWYEYGTFEETPQVGKMATLVDAVSGEKKTINPNYIVSIEEKKLVRVVTDVTAWKNYNKKVCTKATHTSYYWFDKSHNLKDNLIYSELTEEV